MKSAWTKAVEQHRITAIAVPFENESHVITTRSWNGKRIFVIIQEHYDDLRGRR